MKSIPLPDDFLVRFGLIAIRAAASEQLIDMLFQGWFGGQLPSLAQEARALSPERKMQLLSEAFQAALPEDRGQIASVATRMRRSVEDRANIMHEAWVLLEAPSVRELEGIDTDGGPARTRVTVPLLNELDQTLASLLVELTMLFGKASAARSPQLHTSPDRPGAPD